MLRVLDLFSGIGGFSLGLERTGGFETVAFCEFEPFCQKVLRKHWPQVPIFNDVKELHAKDLPGTIDVITGGYPCQPFSLAGKRGGDQDDRHLWPQIVRLLQELDAAGNKPAWCVFENVSGHISMGLDEVLLDLEAEGYTAWPLVIPACAVDAPHRRDRVWIVANSPDGENIRRESGIMAKAERQRGCVHPAADSGCEDVANSNSARRKEQHLAAVTDGSGLGAGGDNAADDPNTKGYRLQRCDRTRCNGEGGGRGVLPESAGDGSGEHRWETFSRLGRMAHGLPRWLDEPGDVPRVSPAGKDRNTRLKALGNSVVPQIQEMIGRAILAATE